MHLQSGSQGKGYSSKNGALYEMNCNALRRIMKCIRNEHFICGKFIVIFSLMLSVSLNIALYKKSKTPIEYPLQGSYQTKDTFLEEEIKYLVIDTKIGNTFSVYSCNGKLLDSGDIVMSDERNFYTMSTESNQCFALVRKKMNAFIFDGREWIEFSFISPAIRIFSNENTT